MKTERDMSRREQLKSDKDNVQYKSEGSGAMIHQCESVVELMMPQWLKNELSGRHLVIMTGGGEVTVKMSCT